MYGCSQESLYSDSLQKREAAVRDLCSVFRQSSNLSLLLQRPALLSVLARLVREDGRKSVDVSLGALSLFCVLSHFPQLQHHVLEHQVGARTITILAFFADLSHEQVSYRGKPGSSIYVLAGTIAA